MKTRRRDYSSNPRSPPKRRRHTVQRRKRILSETLPNSQIKFPDLNLLPPLPPSPDNLTLDFSVIPPLPESPSSVDFNLESSYTELKLNLPPIEPSKPIIPNSNDSPPISGSANSESEIINTFARLTLQDNITTAEIKRDTPSKTYSTLSEKPFVHPKTSFISNSHQSNIKMTDSTLNKRTLTPQDISEARDSLGDETKFEHLATNGSNFVDWKKETARAIKALLGIKNYWDERLPIESYIDRKRDGIALSVINNTIHKTLKNVTDDADSAYEAMDALQNHFRKGGRTAQFSLFSRLMNLRLDSTENEMINHMAKVDAIIAEAESMGFVWNSASIRGLFYQIVMLPEMTKEINKELDNKYDKNNPSYNLKDIKSEIMIYLACERTATETININSLQSHFDAVSINTKPRQYTPVRQSYQPRPNQSYSASPRFNSPRPEIPKIDPMRWNRGPPAWSRNANARLESKDAPIDIPSGAVSGVRAGLPQCFFCGAFGHTYHAGGCKAYDGNSDRLGAHYRDWRKVNNGHYYSLNALYPQQYTLNTRSTAEHSKTHVNSVEIPNESNQTSSSTGPTIMNLEWSSEGFGFNKEEEEIPTEYLFDGGATDA